MKTNVSVRSPSSRRRRQIALSIKCRLADKWDMTFGRLGVFDSLSRRPQHTYAQMRRLLIRGFVVIRLKLKRRKNRRAAAVAQLADPSSRVRIQWPVPWTNFS